MVLEESKFLFSRHFWAGKCPPAHTLPLQLTLSSSCVKPTKLLRAWLCVIWDASSLPAQTALPSRASAQIRPLRCIGGSDGRNSSCVGKSCFLVSVRGWCELSPAWLLSIVINFYRGNGLFCLWKTLRTFCINRNKLGSYLELRPVPLFFKSVHLGCVCVCQNWLWL